MPITKTQRSLLEIAAASNERWAREAREASARCLSQPNGRRRAEGARQRADAYETRAARMRKALAEDKPACVRCGAGLNRINRCCDTACPYHEKEQAA